jgi:hypothetical protein
MGRVDARNIIVGAGELFDCFIASVASITKGAAGTGKVVLDADPAPRGGYKADSLEEGDLILLTDLDAFEDDGVKTVAGWDHETRTITVSQEIVEDQAGLGGYCVFLSRGGTRLGGTEDGSEIKVSREFAELTAAETPVILGSKVTQVGGNVTFNLVEKTLYNLALALGQGIRADDELIVIADENVHYKALRLEVPGPRGKAGRHYIFPRCACVSDAAHRYTNKQGNIACDFRLWGVWNDDLGKFEIFRVIDLPREVEVEEPEE